MKITYDKESFGENNNLPLIEIQFNSLWEMQFASLLCNTEERCNEFLDGFYNCNDVRESLFQYRSYQLNRGRGQDINSGQIEKLIEMKEYSSLISILEELFLEVLQEDIVNILLDYINRGNSVNKMLKKHENRKELRLGRIIL